MMSKKTEWLETFRLKSLRDYVDPDRLSIEEYFRRADEVNYSPSYVGKDGIERWVGNDKPVNISDKRGFSK